jgi:NAD(P)-dependent dehydrogenase (short-subunit alcohol dehydrogenase family)
MKAPLLWVCILANSPYRAALVTGASQRIGRAIALELATQEIAVAVHYHGSADNADSVVAEINGAGGNAAVVQADLASAKETSSLLQAAAHALGSTIDVLVNNASVFECDDITNFKTQDWDHHQAVNLRAPLQLTQALAQQLSAVSQGAVINIVDQRVLKLNPQYLSYTASKAGLWTVTRTCAQALAPNIRVNAIGPGPTLANTRQSAADFAAEAANVPLGHGPALKEITSAVRFILETPSMTGQMITLDGGQHLAWRTADILED